MLVLNKSITDIPVMSLQSGGTLGTAMQPIIDPRKLQIIAYYVAGPRISETSVLHTSDIREYGSLGFIVDDADSIMSLDDDLVRLNEVINFRFSLIGKAVVNEDKKKLGKVLEYTVESDSFMIQKIHVSQSVLKNISSSSLLIHRSQIIEITDHQIIVKSTAIREPLNLGQALNPFRKVPGPRALRPEASDTK